MQKFEALRILEAFVKDPESTKADFVLLICPSILGAVILAHTHAKVLLSTDATPEERTLEFITRYNLIAAQFQDPVDIVNAIQTKDAKEATDIIKTLAFYQTVLSTFRDANDEETRQAVASIVAAFKLDENFTF